MNDQIKREEGVHGKRWSELHGGYFSDPAVAAPLVKKIQDLAGKSRPDIIIDLGGGSGCVLSQLLEAGLECEASLVDLDDSAIQLDVAREAGFSCIRGSVDSFSRCDVGLEQGHFLYIMRSVLHYFGEDGLRPVLKHLLAQARPGEFFVHQTASFRLSQDAKCLNELYRMMRTKKWYPTVDFLCECLIAEGWDVLEVVPGLPLPLTGDALMQRYNLDQADIMSIKNLLSQNFIVSEQVFKETEDSFCAFLHYWIYVCTPATPDKLDKDRANKN